MNNAFEFVQADDERFIAYCDGLATALKHRIEKGELLDDRESKWLRQFGKGQLTTCQKLIDDYTVFQVRNRLDRKP